MTIAASDQSVVLIDGDLRRLSFAESFGLVEGARLTDVLIGRATFADVAERSARHPHLLMLAAGGVCRAGRDLVKRAPDSICMARPDH